jgi:hypothetical protein
MRTIFWLVGGTCTGLGILLAANYGFNLPGGDVATQVSQLGADGHPFLGITWTGYGAITLFLVGMGLMIKANATAWKQTGGY